MSITWEVLYWEVTISGYEHFGPLRAYAPVPAALGERAEPTLRQEVLPTLISGMSPEFSTKLPEFSVEWIGWLDHEDDLYQSYYAHADLSVLEPFFLARWKPEEIHDKPKALPAKGEAIEALILHLGHLRALSGQGNAPKAIMVPVYLLEALERDFFREENPETG